MLLSMATTEAATAEVPWIAIVSLVLGTLFGAGGIAALVKARNDKQLGVAAHEVTEDDAISARWRSIIEMQTASLVEPLQRRLSTLEGKVETLEGELAASRAKYWRAVAYIRLLVAFITKHLPEHAPPHPTPPDDLVGDL